jgi:hypothetical protein
MLNLIDYALIATLCSSSTIIARFIASRTKIEWEKNRYLDYCSVGLMLALSAIMIYVSIRTSVHLWYGFFIGVLAGYLFKRNPTIFAGAALGISFFFPSITQYVIALVVLLNLVLGPKLKNMDFIIFLALAMFFSYIGAFSVELNVFVFSFLSGAFAGIAVKGVGLLWKKG